MIRLMVFLIVLLLASLEASAQALSEPSGEAWYKVVGGILAIPATILGVIISWNLIQKTRLETRKLELDISEKEVVLAEQRKPENSLRLLAFPLGDSQRALLLIVRYVLLELTLRLWGVVPAAMTAVTGTLVGGLYMVTGGEIFGDSTSMVFMSVVPQVLVVALRLVEWIIFFGIGWPLFKDTCALLNIPVKSLLDVSTVVRRTTHVK